MPSDCFHSQVDGIELSVHVLTTGFWPTQVGANCSLPPQILSCCDAFKELYLKQHSGRRLQWQPNMGNADLKAVFSSRKHEINVSTYQMCILLLFNTSDQMSYEEIQIATSIPVADLKRALQSLACAKFKVCCALFATYSLSPDAVPCATPVSLPPYLPLPSPSLPTLVFWLRGIRLRGMCC